MRANTDKSCVLMGKTLRIRRILLKADTVFATMDRNNTDVIKKDTDRGCKVKRIERIHTLVKEYTSNISLEDLEKKDCGISSIDIADQTEILRNNVSQDLNQLHRQRQLIKIKGKPVRYLSVKEVSALLEGTIHSKDFLFQSAADLLQAPKTKIVSDDPFMDLIGAEGSLSAIIQSAKASILYPPLGLHTLLLGESGTGKSLFAEVMFDYGKLEGVFSTESEFVRLNCADYANNPQFLLSTLFGSVKGAYTGAEKDQVGMIEAASGGVLFLDEIHRLPPEGQEMLFHFIDKKVFRRLGETNNERTSEVLIIAATTETVSNHLLTTFLRRIPATIWLPNLDERGPKERLELVESYCRQEAAKLNTTVELSREALLLFANYHCKGNLGQLRSDVQLTIARAYLETRQKSLDRVVVDTKMLPAYILQKREPLTPDKRQILEKNLPAENLIIAAESRQPSKNLIIEHDFVDHYLNKILTSQEKVSLEELFSEYTSEIARNMMMEDNYSVLFDPLTREIAATLSEFMLNEVKLDFEENIYLSLALFIRNIQQNSDTRVSSVFPEDLTELSSQSIKIAKRMIKIIEKRFNIICEENEVTILSVIINTLVEGRKNQEIRFMIVAHGESTASSLCDTINHLLNTELVVGLDMPLSVEPTQTVTEIKNVMASYSPDCAWVVFVDMGFLTQLDQLMEAEKQNEVYVLETTDVLIILESVRKALFTSRTAAHIVSDIAKMSEIQNEKIQRKIKEYLSIKMNRIIYTVCASGEGVALFLEQIVGDFLRENHYYDVQIIPLNGSANDVSQMIRSTSQDKSVVAVIGSIQPETLNTPFLSLNEVLMGQGFSQLLYLLGGEVQPSSQQLSSIDKATQELALQLCQESLDKYLLYLSADKLSSVLKQVIFYLEETLAISFSNNMLTKLFIHMGCMVERIIFKEETLTITEENKEWLAGACCELDAKIKEAVAHIEDLFNIVVNENERFYLIEILGNELPELLPQV